MMRKAFYLVVMMALTSVSWAQANGPTAPSEYQVYCAGKFTTVPPPSDTYIISGIESAVKFAFNQGDLVFINRGAKQGVQVGNEFLVSRPMKDPSAMQWFIWQKALTRSMGQGYADIGRLRVVHVEGNTSTAEIVFFCDQVQRGDIVVPFTAREAPNYKPASKLDIFASRSGKEMAMVVTMRDFSDIGAAGSIIYVNLGTGQGVHVGDYYRIFRYQGDHDSTMYNTKDSERAIYGFGAAPAGWNWSTLPREVLGEGIVLSASPNSSTVLITNSVGTIYAGDYVEVE